MRSLASPAEVLGLLCARLFAGRLKDGEAGQLKPIGQDRLRRFCKGENMSHCELTGKGPAVKNLVSHSNIKTKSRAFPNIQRKRFFSNQLNQYVRLRAAVSAIRDIDKTGDFDVFIVQQADGKLSPRALKIKKKILKKTSKPAGKVRSVKRARPVAKGGEDEKKT